jgi:pSer/pThr/pTyr-binding forkhead associated (FHA) protein
VGFDLPKGSAELAMPEPGGAPPQPSGRAADPSTERDASVRKGTWLNTKTKAPRGHLVVITKEGTPGPSYPIYDQVDIGRSEGDVVLAEDRYLSPRHARLVFREDRFFLRDLDSVNGLFLRVSALRGRKVSEIERAAVASGAPASQVANVDTNIAMELQDQDLILIGQQVLRFEALRDAEAGLGPASEHGTLLFGTPTSPRYARLSQRTVEGVTRDVYYIRKVETVLGRESGDVVFTDDPFLSRRHAAFLVLPALPTAAAAGTSSPSQDRKGNREAQPKKRSAIHLVDLGSSNGTFLGLRGETEVRSGDLVRMGQQLFRIDLGAPNA